jgi:hypothetical protein
MRKALVLLIIILLVPACATSINRDVADQLQAGKIATAFYMESKRIHYFEVLYRVLWNEIRAQDAVFEGFWDIDHEFSQLMAQNLTRKGLNSLTLQEILQDKEQYKEFVNAVRITRGKYGIEAPLTLPQPLLNTLKSRNITHVVMLRCLEFQVGSFASHFPQGGLPSLLVVYDINQNKQVYSEPLYMMTYKLAIRKSPREIESNNLLILKKAARKMVAKTLNGPVVGMLGATSN